MDMVLVHKPISTETDRRPHSAQSGKAPPQSRLRPSESEATGWELQPSGLIFSTSGRLDRVQSANQRNWSCERSALTTTACCLTHQQSRWIQRRLTLVQQGSTRASLPNRQIQPVSLRFPTANRFVLFEKSATVHDQPNSSWTFICQFGVRQQGKVWQRLGAQAEARTTERTHKIARRRGHCVPLNSLMPYLLIKGLSS
jgi:hypothetical protein